MFVGGVRPTPVHGYTQGGDVSAGSVIPVDNLGGVPDQECDDGNDGWHFVLSGIVVAGGTTLDAADVPTTMSIHFSNGDDRTAGFVKVTGGVAHYLNSTDHQNDGVYPVSGSLTLPTPTDIVSYSRFNLSHIPCSFPGTTTTVAETTTTVAATTTTQAATTTTVAATTTTQAATTTTQPATTTTVAATTTTTVPVTVSSVAQEAPGITTTTVPATTTTARATTTSQVLSNALPTTGGGAGPLAMLGLVLFGLGVTLTLLFRPVRKA
jgi:hypothetical protein